MNINWRNHVVDESANSDFRDRVERRLHRVLRFFPHRVTAVRVSVNDINGTRGGIDQQVRIQVCGSPFGEIVASATGQTLHAAAAEAVLKTGSAVHRALQRRRTRRIRARRSSARALTELSHLPDFRDEGEGAPDLEDRTVFDDSLVAVGTA